MVPELPITVMRECLRQIIERAKSGLSAAEDIAMNETETTTNGRQPDGRFAPGFSGNSLGRPKARGKAALIREALYENWEEAIAKIKERALAGDRDLLKWWCSRILPELRAVDLPSEIKGLDVSKTWEEKTSCIQKALVAGEMSVQDALVLMQTFSNAARIAEATELKRKIEALEAELAARNRAA